MWSTGGGDGKPLQYSCCGNPMTRMKGKKIWQWKVSHTGWKVSSMVLGKSGGQLTANSSRKNEGAGPKWK